MSIYAEKRRGKLTGRFVIEVTNNGSRTRRVRKDLPSGRVAEARLIAGEVVPLDEAAETYTLGWLIEQSVYIWDGARDDQAARRLEIIADLLGRGTDIASLRVPQLTKDRKS